MSNRPSTANSVASGGSNSHLSTNSGPPNVNNNNNAAPPAAGNVNAAGQAINAATNSMKLTVKHAFGCHASKIDAIQSYSAIGGNKDYADRLIHKVGKQLCIFDPETSKKEFFDSRGKNVLDVVHFSISANGKFVAMCEIIRHTLAGTSANPTTATSSNDKAHKDDKAAAESKDNNAVVNTHSNNSSSSQVSVYSLTSMNKLKTLHHNTYKPFVCATFCGDPKLLAALSDEPERQIVVWQWEKEKLYKSLAVNNVGVNLLRSAPSTTLMLTTSGPAALRHWTLGPDGNMKGNNFLPPAKEQLDIYTDHVWMPTNLGSHRMIALADPDSNNDLNRARKQCVYVFEGTDNHAKNDLGTAHGTAIPLLMELKQTIQLKLEPGCRIEKILPSAKTFSLVGLYGIVLTFERTDDKHEPYVEARRLSIGDVHLVGGTVYPSEEKMVVLTKAHRMLVMNMDITAEQLKKQGKSMLELPDDNGSLDNSLDEESLGGHSKRSSLAAKAKIEDDGEAAHKPSISDLTNGGYHTSAVLAADIAFERPLLVTIGADCTARVWNYITGKCELVHHFRNDEPVAVAFHTNGFQILVSFKDRVKSYNVLMDKIKPCRETVLKNCKCLKYSNGAQYWAGASGINVVVYETRTFQQLMAFQGHMMTVVRLCWAPGDQVLFSAGMDGNVYGWPIAKDGRIDCVNANNRSSAILDLVVDSPPTVFPAHDKEHEDDSTSQTGGNAHHKAAADLSYDTLQRSWIVVSSLDGHLKMPNWYIDQAKSHSHSSALVTLSPANQQLNSMFNKVYPTTDTAAILYGESSVYITAMQISADRTRLFVGTSSGSIRVYPWPPEPHTVPMTPPVVTPIVQKEGQSGHAAPGHHHNHNPYTHQHLCFEAFIHTGPVVAIRLGPVENTVISAGADGSIFVHAFSEDPKAKATKKPAKNASSMYDPYDSNDDEAVVLNDEVILLAMEDIEDHVNEVVELQKLLSETKAQNEFQARKLESEHNETLKRISEQHENLLTHEKEVFEKQRNQFDKRIRELMSAMEVKENDHIKIMTELENKYEHKLADQLERYDLLSEKMQILKQKCEGLLEAEKNNFNKQINELKNETNNREKKLRIENRRAIEDKIANESAFREIITQQEDEYEDELKQLIKAAESELVSERDTILKLRTLVQTKNTKLDQLKKKFIELQSASKARMILLTQERDEKQKLLDTIDHYKKNLIEREDALAEKEKMVLELRSKTRTLENFRFVLDHRLQQLSSERGPITSHIEGLEKHIATMYEELVEEFANKKSATEASALKDQKIQWLSQDIGKMRQSVREKEQYIAAFKREIGNIVSAMVVGKELEESVKSLYKKFVRGEQSNGDSKSTVKLNARVADTVTEMLHGGRHAKISTSGSAAHLDADDQSFLSLETGNKGGNGGGNLNGGPSKAFIQEVEDALVDTAMEADRQKRFVERQSKNLKHRLRMTEKESNLTSRHRLHENSDLLFECNDLRMENRELQREMDILKHDLDQTQRHVHELKNELADTKKLSRSPTRRGRSFEDPNATAAAGTGGRGVNPNPADWVVHNSLPSTAIPLSASSMRDDNVVAIPSAAGDDSSGIHSLHGVTAELKKKDYSKSMPLLHTDDSIDFDAPDELRNTHTASPPSNKGKKGIVKGSSGIREKVLSQSQPLLPQAKGANITIPKAEWSSTALPPKPKPGKGRGVGSVSSSGIPASATVLQNQIERLHGECEGLAQQLDESIREREMQRLELSRLRKQLMSVSQQPSLTLQANPSTSGSILQLPSITGVDSLPSITQQGSLVHLANSKNSLTHADVHGVPSEEDKRELRLGPAGSTVSAKSRASSGNNAVSSRKGSANRDLRDAANEAKRTASREGGGRKDLRELSLHSFESGAGNEEV